MPLSFTNAPGGNIAECLSKGQSQSMKKAGKTYSCTWLLIHRLFQRRTVPLGDDQASVIILFMANIA